MTVSSSVARVSYTGNGDTVNFSTGFPFISESELLVTLADTNGIETVQLLTTNYTVAGEGGVGVITMTVAPPTNYTLVITRNMDFLQETDYVENDDFPALSHEKALDKLTMIVQQINEFVLRTPYFKITTGLTGTVFPDPSQGDLIAWNDTGTALENVSPAATDVGVSGINEVGTHLEFTKQTVPVVGALTSASTITWPANTSQVATLTLDHNGTLSLPTSVLDNAFYMLIVTQGSTGGTLAYDSAYKWPGNAVPVLSTTTGKKDILSFYYDGTNMLGIPSIGYSA